MGPWTVARNALRPSNFRVMVGKVYLRGRYGRREMDAAREWAAGRAEDLDAWAAAVDPDLWAETVAFATNLEFTARARLQPLRDQGISLGGGGAVPLIYFLTRRLRPHVVVETGVAAGWSSQAVLHAMDRNGIGHLYSSDFPYFRLDDPERYIGYLVDDDLKGRWTLQTKGDRANVPKILAEELDVELVHYDSDKSRAGRAYFMRQITPHLTPEAVVVMDDIDDDLFFRDLADGRAEAKVFSYGGKFVGVLLPAGF